MTNTDKMDGYGLNIRQLSVFLFGDNMSISPYCLIISFISIHIISEIIYNLINFYSLRVINHNCLHWFIRFI